MPIHIRLTDAGADALVQIIEAVDLPALFPDGRNRRAAIGAITTLTDAIRGRRPDRLDTELAALAVTLTGVHHIDAVALFAERLRALLETVETWSALEAAGQAAARVDDGAAVVAAAALARLALVERSFWPEAVRRVVERVGLRPAMLGAHPT